MKHSTLDITTQLGTTASFTVMYMHAAQTTNNNVLSKPNTALHFTLKHCTILYCTMLQCTTLDYTAL